MVRASGVLMPVSSLPGFVGIGTFGREAYEFIDFLARTHQRYWQVLPLTTTSFGDSPYQSFSAFAGNPYFIDLEDLLDSGYLTKKDLEALPIGHMGMDTVDYGELFQKHRAILERALPRFIADPPEDYEEFCKQNASWLEPYCEFMTIKEQFELHAYYEWPEEYRKRSKKSAKLCAKHEDDMQYHRMTQYFFYRDWKRLKKYANDHGILIIGDIPIYVSRDSVEMWSAPEMFCTDKDGTPTCVAGTPPDVFSDTGQYWGNPIYDWKQMKKDGFSWWIERLQASLSLYDILRIDHFRGFAAYWAVPFGSPDSSYGKWVKGPGEAIFDAAKEKLGDLPIIAEDLGFMTPDVIALREHTGFPGMKILQFGFDSLDSDSDSFDLPHHYSENTVAYAGTHDNETVVGWFKDSATPKVRKAAAHYLHMSEDENIAQAIDRAVAASVSDTCIYRMQDLLGLDNSARINVPSTVGANWRWRMLPGAITPAIEQELTDLTYTYFRIPDAKGPELPQ